MANGVIIFPSPDGEGSIFVNPKEVIRFEVIGNYTMAYSLGGKAEKCTYSLDDIEDKLPKGAFIRVSEKDLINVCQISNNMAETENSVKMADGAFVSIAMNKANLQQIRLSYVK